eukprot:SAG22_NODE_11006_length_505_cov_1.002463_1_plen_55_part_10
MPHQAAEAVGCVKPVAAGRRRRGVLGADDAGKLPVGQLGPHREAPVLGVQVMEVR